MSLTHRDLTRAAARWLLDFSGIHAATYELAVDGGQADAIGVSTPDPAAATELRVGEYARAQQYRHDAYNRRIAKAAKKRGDLFEPIDFGSASSEWLTGYRERSIKRLAGPSLGGALVAADMRWRTIQDRSGIPGYERAP